MLDHFAECIKQAKGVRQQAVQINIFTAVLSALKVGLFYCCTVIILSYIIACECGTPEGTINDFFFLSLGFSREQEYSGP